MFNCKANSDRLRGYKVQIYPTEEQIFFIHKIMHLYRASYNLTKELQDKSYEEGNGYIRYIDMDKRLTDLKNNSEEYSWLNEIDTGCIRQAIRDVDTAYMKFFKGICRYPKFKSRKNAKMSFGTRRDRCYIRGNYIQISGLPRNINLVFAKSHPIPEDSELWNPRVSFDGYRYYFSCQVEKDIIDMNDIPQTDIVGVDVGLNPMMVTSDGSKYRFPDNKKFVKRVKRQQRRLHKYYQKYLAESIRTRTKYEDVPKSKNYEKKLKKHRDTYKKMHDRDITAIHTATKEIVSKNPFAIVIETLSVKEQKQDVWFAKYQPQFSFYEMHRQLKYKAADRGIPVIQVEKEFPSTKTCSRCGFVKPNVRGKTYVCPSCGLRIDRDLNASINLREYGRFILNSTIAVA